MFQRAQIEEQQTQLDQKQQNVDATRRLTLKGLKGGRGRMMCSYLIVLFHVYVQGISQTEYLITQFVVHNDEIIYFLSSIP